MYESTSPTSPAQDLAIASHPDIDASLDAARLRDEVEQLRTALENADEEQARLIAHRDQLLERTAAQARDLQTVSAAFTQARREWAEAQDTDTGPRAEEEALRVAFEELQVVTEELEVANSSLVQANRELDKKVAERTRVLTLSEGRFRSLVEGFAKAVWEVDDPATITHQLSEIRGSRTDRGPAGSGLEWLESLHRDDLPKLEQRWAAAVAERSILNTEVRISGGSGEWCWVNARATPVRDGEGVIRKWVGMTIDVTDRRRAEEQVRASEERLGLALSVGGLATWDWNLSSGRVEWSDEHFWMLGYRVGEITPSFEAWASRLLPEDRSDTIRALDHSRTGGSEFSQEFRVVWPNGVVRSCLSRGRFYHDEAGEPVRMIGVMEDVTADREASARLQVLVAELQHRTRNIITVVRALSERTLRGVDSLEDFRTCFTDRLEALARVQGMLSRLDTGDRIAFDELLTAEIAAMGLSERSDQLSLDGPRGVRLRSSIIQTFALALHELATNALKYGALAQPQGRLSVAWRLTTREGRQWLEVDWRETGAPPPAEPADRPRRQGYGRELIERALPYQLKAETRYELTEQGVRCAISLPVEEGSPAPP